MGNASRIVPTYGLQETVTSWVASLPRLITLATFRDPLDVVVQGFR